MLVNIYKIGEFENVVKSNIKTIRYYDEIDLLKPKVIDKFTSYRYYDEDNVREYYAIILLKQREKSRSNIVNSKIKLNNFDNEISNIDTRKKER